MKKIDLDVVIPLQGMKVLELDIETSPNVCFTWGLFKQNIALNQLITPTQILCFAARWQHQKKVIYKSIHHHHFEEMVETLWDLLNEADVIVHFNGQRFDIPHINRELIEMDFRPPSPYQNIDLYQICSRTFRFSSNKMDHIVDRLLGQRKIEHEGQKLWTDCLNDLPSAWRTMKEYNVHDTRLLRPLYLKVQPWIKQHPNRGLFVTDTDDPVCPNCASKDLRVKAYRPGRPGYGTAKTRVNVYPQYLCMDCGKYSRGRTSIKRNRIGILT